MEGQRNKEIGAKSHGKTMGTGENQRISEKKRGKERGENWVLEEFQGEQGRARERELTFEVEQEYS
jgi:hypothetical protein